MGKKGQMVSYLFWIVLSTIVMVLSLKLGLEDKAGAEGLRNPGPGLMPFLISLFLLGLSLFLLLSRLFRRVPGEEEGRKFPEVNYGKLLLLLVPLFGYAFLLDLLGYSVVTFLLLGTLFWRMGTKWPYALGASVGTTLLTYLVFTRLGLLFPERILNLPGILR